MFTFSGLRSGPLLWKPNPPLRLVCCMHLRACADAASINQALPMKRSRWKRLSSRDQWNLTPSTMWRGSAAHAIWSRCFGAAQTMHSHKCDHVKFELAHSHSRTFWSQSRAVIGKLGPSRPLSCRDLLQPWKNSPARSLLVVLKTMITWFRCVWLGLELNSEGKWPGRAEFARPWSRAWDLKSCCNGNSNRSFLQYCDTHQSDPTPPQKKNNQLERLHQRKVCHCTGRLS